MSNALIEAVRSNDIANVRRLLDEGAEPNTRGDGDGLTVLMMAACQANPDMVKVLLDAGADVTMADRAAGATALHKACQGGSLEVIRYLVEAGSFVDAVAPTTGHTPLMDAIWFKYPEIVEYLLEQNAGINLGTHYGFPLKDHVQYELNVNVFGKDKVVECGRMLDNRRESDQQTVDRQPLMKAVTDDSVETVRQLIAQGVSVDERQPILNGFNDGHPPLLVACRDGHTAIVKELLEAGADVNAVEPTFGAVPLHKAVYNGHADITQLLVERPGIDLDFQGATNGYSPLHDSLWHGYDACARILVEAGARLDLRGHDGKTPLDIALENFGPDHAIVQLIRSHGGLSAHRR